jgi:hypothetical protein
LIPFERKIAYGLRIDDVSELIDFYFEVREVADVSHMDWIARIRSSRPLP